MDAIKDFFNYVGNQLSSVELTDIIDIVIVAFFLYYLFKFVRDRRAGKLALGVLVLMLMLVVSSWLQMRVTNYIGTRRRRRFYRAHHRIPARAAQHARKNGRRVD